MRISDWSSDVCSSDLTYYETHRQSCPRHWRRDGNDHSVAVDDLRAGEARRVPEAGPYRSQPRRLAPLGGHCVARSEEHTSETPVTNAHLVCRLLLDKKHIKTKDNQSHPTSDDTNYNKHK